MVSKKTPWNINNTSTEESTPFLCPLIHLCAKKPEISLEPLVKKEAENALHSLIDRSLGMELLIEDSSVGSSATTEESS